MWHSSSIRAAESILKKIYEPVILRKLGLSENFPRSVLYSRKTALGIGLLAPATIIDVLALKLYFGHKRANDRIGKAIQINEDNARIQYGYSKSIVEVDQNMKPNKVIWSDEVQQKLSRQKLVIINRIDEPKWVSKNKTIMDMVVEYVKETKDNSKVISILNQV